MSEPTEATDGHVLSPERILAAYELLLRRSRCMLASARAQDWDALLAEQTRYVMDVEWLGRHEARLPLPADASERKMMLLEQILEQEIEVRRCLTTRRDELGRLLGSSLRQRDLGRAYRPRERGRVDVLPLYNPDKT